MNTNKNDCNHKGIQRRRITTNIEYLEEWLLLKRIPAGMITVKKEYQEKWLLLKMTVKKDDYF